MLTWLWRVGIAKVCKKRTNLTESQQAAVIAEYADLLAQGLPTGSVADLADKYEVNRNLPGRLYHAAKSGAKPPASRKGVGGRPARIGPEAAQMIKDTLRAHGWDMTFAEMEEATGIGHSVLHRWYRQEVESGRWREVGKGYRPLLTDEHRAARLKFAKKNKNNRWYRHVDIDEKWFHQ